MRIIVEPAYAPDPSLTTHAVALRGVRDPALVRAGGVLAVGGGSPGPGGECGPRHPDLPLRPRTGRYRQASSYIIVFLSRRRI